MSTGARLRLALRVARYAGIPLAAIVLVYLATRGAPPAAPRAAHEHVASPDADRGRPVMLSSEESRRIGVTYAAAVSGPLRTEVRTVGQVTVDETRVRAIAPKIDGWVEHLYVDFTGQRVGAGDPLLSVYSPMLVTAQEELLLAHRLRSDLAAGSADARGGANELLASARRRLAYWDIPEGDIARIERSGEVRRTLVLRAPVSGYVVEKRVLEGEKIMAGETLYRIADLRAVWVEGEVFEQDLSSVRVGARVTALFQALPGEAFSGRITYLYPTLDPETRTARVRVALPNPALRLKPGMYATLLIAGVARPSAITVPRSAVLATGERSLVFVKRADGMLEPREVTTGATNDERVEIVRGLEAGDTVVRSATFLVDAESNLGTALGGMGSMPGMDMTAPAPTPPAGTTARPAPPASPATHAASARPRREE